MCAYIIKINKIFDVFIQELKHVSLVGFRSHFNHQKRLDENETKELDDDDDAVTHPTTHTYTRHRARGETERDAPSEYGECGQMKRRRKITSLSDRIYSHDATTMIHHQPLIEVAYVYTFAMERRKTVGGVKNTVYAKNK